MNAPFVVSASINAFSYVSTFPIRGSDDVRRRLTHFVVQTDYAQPTTETVFRTFQVLRALEEAGFKEFEAFLGDDGEILLSAYRDPLCFEITVEPDGSYSVNVEVAGARVAFAERVAPAKVSEHLNDAMRLQWISSGGYARVGGVRGSSAGRVSPSKSLPAKMVAPVSSNTLVPLAQAVT